MRYELSDEEWTAIRPMLPNKPRGVPRVNDRRILNGIFWVLRSGAPWRDLPDSHGPPTMAPMGHTSTTARTTTTRTTILPILITTLLLPITGRASASRLGSRL